MSFMKIKKHCKRLFIAFLIISVSLFITSCGDPGEPSLKTVKASSEYRKVKLTELTEMYSPTGNFQGCYYILNEPITNKKFIIFIGKNDYYPLSAVEIK